MLTVKGNKGVAQALEQYFQFEELEGVECEVCNTKTTQFKGPRISRLPPVLTFCLNRIELDYETWERKKINDPFEYPMELDMRNYVDQDLDAASSQQIQDPDLCIYELKSIVIHRGGPYGGHYHAFIRDDLEDGNWDIEVPDQYQAEPTEVKKEEPAKKEE